MTLALTLALILVCAVFYQLDSICSNELGEPNALVRVADRSDVNALERWNEARERLAQTLHDIHHRPLKSHRPLRSRALSPNASPFSTP